MPPPSFLPQLQQGLQETAKNTQERFAGPHSVSGSLGRAGRQSCPYSTLV